LNYLADILAVMNKEWPDNRTVNIVCHGHSVPAGYFKTPKVEAMNSYPHLLHSELADRFPHAVLNVIVTAIGGEHSASGAARFEREVLTHRPDVLTIDYGLNDRGLGLEKSRCSWAEMIEKALSRQIKVILLTPTGDLGARLDDPGDSLNLHAELIRSLARQYQVWLQRCARYGTGAGWRNSCPRAIIPTVWDTTWLCGNYWNGFRKRSSG
jgi:hypothetical protein